MITYDITDWHRSAPVALKPVVLLPELRAIMSVITVFTNQPFGPEEIEILAAAFDDAWETIKRSGSTFASPGYAGGARYIVAKHIIELARAIMDRHQLSADAVANLANSYRYERVADPRRKAALF